MFNQQRLYHLIGGLAVILLLSGCFARRTTPHKRDWETTAQEKRREQHYIQQIGTTAQRVYQTKHQVLPSVIIAQAIIEADWGRSDLATKANNLFGVKGAYQGKRILMTTDEYQQQKRVTIKDYFKVYPTIEVAIQDHSDFLSVGTYANLRTLSTYTEQAALLQRAGYATDPNYAEKLIKAIQGYHLQKYDPSPQ